jgi:hypothetical protein
MRSFWLAWMLVVGLTTVVVGLGGHAIADMPSIPRTPGQYVMIGLAVALAGLANTPMFMFRRG